MDRSEKYDAILIDDDPLMHSVWGFIAKRKNKKYLAFHTVDAFLNSIDAIDRTSPVHIDLNLGEGIRGDIVSKRIFDVGFRQIILQTGFSRRDSASPPWISAIRGKETPWEDQL